MRDTPNIRLYLTAADAARTLLDHPQLETRWQEPSALDRMTIGDLAAHLSRSVTVIEKYLESPGAPPFVDAPGYYLSIFPTADLDPASPLATGVRDRSSQESASGISFIRHRWDSARQRLEVLAESGDPSLTAFGISMRLSDYVVTRMVELVVHADDLAVSLDAPVPEFPTDVTDAVTGCLVEIASRRVGALAVIRAMTRHERAQGTELRVL